MTDNSKLAAGARSAAFQVEGSGEQLHDLKTLTREQFEAKYILDAGEYNVLLVELENGKDIPLLIRVESTVSRKLEPGEVIPMPNKTLAEQGVKMKTTVPEKVRYAGEALGLEVLVVRTEREHSSQLIIPESAKAKSDIGFIVAHGPEAVRAKASGGPGALVLFDRFAAHGKEIDLVDDQGVARQHLLLNDVDLQLKLTRKAQPSEA
jgi:co-chaperonin GroES (HSP10)